MWKAIELQAANLHLAEDMFVNPLLAAPAHLRVGIEHSAASVHAFSDGDFRAAMTESVKANKHLQEVALAIASVIPFEGTVAKSAGWGEKLVVQATGAERAAAQRFIADLVKELSATGRQFTARELYDIAASRLLPRADVAAVVNQIAPVTARTELRSIEAALQQSLRQAGDTSRFGQAYHDLIGAAKHGPDFVEASGRYRELKTTLVPVVDRFLLEPANHQLVGYLLRDLAEHGIVRPGVVEHLFVRAGPSGTVKEAVRLVLDPLGGRPVTHLIPGR